MLGTAVIGSGHIVLARNFSNSGNYLVNDQKCTAGNSCYLSSSNTVSSGSSGLTSPSPTPTPTTLTVEVIPNEPITGTLRTDTGSAVVGATITFTQVDPIGNTTPVATNGPVVTNNNGNYQAFPTVMLNTGFNITAHYAGAPPVNALAASSASNIIP
jgi:hypothetical protein